MSDASSDDMLWRRLYIRNFSSATVSQNTTWKEVTSPVRHDLRHFSNVSILDVQARTHAAPESREGATGVRAGFCGSSPPIRPQSGCPSLLPLPGTASRNVG